MGSEITHGAADNVRRPSGDRNFHLDGLGTSHHIHANIFTRDESVEMGKHVLARRGFHNPLPRHRGKSIDLWTVIPERDFNGKV